MQIQLFDDGASVLDTNMTSFVGELQKVKLTDGMGTIEVPIIDLRTNRSETISLNKINMALHDCNSVLRVKDMT